MVYHRIIPQFGWPFGINLGILPEGGMDQIKDEENITDEELVDIVNWRFNPERWAWISAVFGDPDFLPFSILEQGVSYGKAVARLLCNFSDDQKIQEIIDKIHEYERVRNKNLNIDELSEILSIKDSKDIFDSSSEQPSKSLTVDKVKSLMPIPIGTGFLVGRNYLLTNHHVLPTQADANNMIVEFGYEQDILGRNITPIQCNLNTSFFVTNEKLDYTLVKVEQKQKHLGSEIGDYFGWIPMEEDSKVIAPPLNLEQVQERKLTNISPKVLERLERPADLTGNKLGLSGEPVSIIQHPKGRYKKIVLFSNRVQKITNNFLYYEADSDFGSSGSPVFNQRWNLVALHRAVVTSDGDNINSGIVGYEGVRICKIVKDLINKLTPQDPGRTNIEVDPNKIKSFIIDYVFITEETKLELDKQGFSKPEYTEKGYSTYPAHLPPNLYKLSSS